MPRIPVASRGTRGLLKYVWSHKVVSDDLLTNRVQQYFWDQIRRHFVINEREYHSLFEFWALGWSHAKSARAHGISTARMVQIFDRSIRKLGHPERFKEFAWLLEATSPIKFSCLVGINRETFSHGAKIKPTKSWAPPAKDRLTWKSRFRKIVEKLSGLKTMMVIQGRHLKDTMWNKYVTRIRFRYTMYVDDSFREAVTWSSRDPDVFIDGPLPASKDAVRNWIRMVVDSAVSGIVDLYAQEVEAQTDREVSERAMIRLFNMPIDQLCFSYRVYRILTRYNVLKVGTLVNLRPKDLLELLEMGPKSVGEIKKKLITYGLRLRDDDTTHTVHWRKGVPGPENEEEQT